MKITITKFPLWQTDELDRFSGTHYIGEVKADFQVLSIMLGNPTFFRPEASQDFEKTIADWCFRMDVEDESEDPEDAGDRIRYHFSLYDWKVGAMPWFCLEWNVGGRSHDQMGLSMLQRVIDAIADGQKFKREKDSPEGFTFEIELPKK